MTPAKAIDAMFAELHESWMNDEDKAAFERETLLAIGKSREDLERDINIGVSNGHPIEEQLEKISCVIKVLVVPKVNNIRN